MYCVSHAGEWPLEISDKLATHCLYSDAIVFTTRFVGALPLQRSPSCYVHFGVYTQPLVHDCVYNRYIGFIRYVLVYAAITACCEPALLLARYTMYLCVFDNSFKPYAVQSS